MTTDVGGCLIAKSKEGLITEQRARDAAKRLDELKAESRNAAEAGDKLAREQAEELARKQWTRLNEVRRQVEAIDRIDRNKNQGAQRLARSFFEFIAGQQIAGPNIAREFNAVRQNAHALMSDTIERFRTTQAGLSNPVKTEQGQVLERDIVREMFGEATGNTEAKGLANGIKESLEYLRTEFNRVGGNIKFRDDFGLPQQHDPRLVENVSRDDWISEIKPMLDRDKMINEDTGLRFSESEIDGVLRDTYDTIVSRGLDDMDPTNPKFGSRITTRHQHRRFIQFRSADDWLTYQKKFGPGGSAGANGKAIFSAQRHIDMMARDIAAMRVLGPNPRSTIQTISDKIKSDFNGKDEQPLMENLFMESTGKSNAPINEKVAGFGIASRSVLQSALLGQAFFSSLTDVGFSQTAAKFAGLPQFRLLKRQMETFAPSGGADRRQAVRLGLGAQGAIDQAMASARVSGEALGDPGTLAGGTRKVADTVMRASLLQPWTEAGKWAFGTEMLATLTERAGRSLDQLDDPLRRTLERNGIDAAGWDRIRNAPKFTDPETGADFIRPIEVMRAGNREDANALQRMISAETEFAVPSSFASARNQLRFGTRPGTFSGELVRSAAMLKNFPVTVMMLQWGRFMQINGGLNKAKYASGLIATTGALGVIGEQMSSVADGKNPRPMDGSEGTADLMLDGMWRAGSFGLMGDIAFTNFDKFGSSLAESLAGPVLSTLGDAQSLSFGNAIKTLSNPETRDALFSGDLGQFNRDTDIGRDALRFAQGLTPGQNLWWTNLITQRLLFDQLQAAADPEYANSFRRMEQIAEDQGTEFFFRPQALLDQ